MQKLTSYIDANLQKKARFLHRLTLSIRMHLPADLANHCWVASIENHTLTIITDDPSRASLVRFQQREILKQLNQELRPTVKEYLNRLKIKVGNTASGIDPPTKPQLLTDTSAKQINECANELNDKDLKDVLRRLAMRCANN